MAFRIFNDLYILILKHISSKEENRYCSCECNFGKRDLLVSIKSEDFIFMKRIGYYDN